MAFEIGSLSAETTVRAAQATRTPGGAGSTNIVAIRGTRQDLAGIGISAPAEPPDEAGAEKKAAEAALATANELPQQLRRSLEFRLDEDYGRPIITIRDTETEEVIRQIPPEEIVEFSKYLRELAENQGEQITGLVVRLEA
ncbi:MAG: flagellar protein FlaG [Gammaproteobacteria bacterium]|nr:flagellar protein FlaG [Gammaproteobacteria bacterium]